jgi:hypothetical protein
MLSAAEAWRFTQPAGGPGGASPLPDDDLMDIDLNPPDPPEHCSIDINALEAREHEQRRLAVAARPAPESTRQALTDKELDIRDEVLYNLLHWASPTFASDAEKSEFERQEEEYVVRVAKKISILKEAFGQEQPYQLKKDMQPFTKKGLISVAFDGAMSGVTSGFRSPSGNALGIFIQKYRSFVPIDLASLNAIIQGSMAYAAEGVVAALIRVAQSLNLAYISPVDFKGVLSSEDVKSGAALLDIKQGVRGYLCANRPGVTTAESLDESAKRSTARIGKSQEKLDGKSYAVFAVPLLSGGFNALRRFASSESILKAPAPVFATSFLASGAASGVGVVIQKLLQTRAQVEIDDLVGGKQKVNLFKLEKLRDDVPSVQWRDIGGFLPYLKKSVYNSVSNGVEAFRNWGSSAMDLGARYIVVNGFSNAMGMGVGGMMEMVLRPGGSFSPLLGESPRERAQVIGQILRSAVGDGSWRAMNSWMRGSGMNNNTSKDLRDTTQAAVHLQNAEAGVLKLRDTLNGLSDGDAEWTGLRERLMALQLMELDGWKQAKEEVSHIGTASSPDLRHVLTHIEGVINSLVAHHSLKEKLKSE